MSDGRAFPAPLAALLVAVLLAGTAVVLLLPWDRPEGLAEPRAQHRPLAAPPGAPEGAGLALGGVGGQDAAANTEAGGEEEGPPPVRLPVEERPGPHDPEGPAGLLLHGTVLDEDGAPVPAAMVALSDRRTSTTRPQLTGEDGAYRVEGVAPGTFRLYVQKRGRKLHYETLELGASPEAVRHDVVLSRAALLRVRIQTPDGLPLEEALRAGGGFPRWVRVLAVATAARPAGHLPLTTTSGWGRYGVGSWRGARESAAPGEPDFLPAGVAGELELGVEPPVFVSAVLHHVVLATEAVAPGQEEVTLSVPLEAVRRSLATVRLRVVSEADGRPLAGVRVAISDRRGAQAGRTTGGDGRVVLEGQPPGLVVFSVSAPDHEAVREYRLLAPGGDHDLGDLRLHEAVAIRGTVVDAAGRPVQARVFAQNLDSLHGPAPWDLWLPPAEPGPPGEFTLPGVGRRRYVLRAAAGHVGSATVLVDTTAGPVEGVVLRLARGVPVVVENTIPPDQARTVTIRDSGGLPVWGQRLRPLHDETAHLVPGTYRIEVRDDAGHGPTLPLVVGTIATSFRVQ